jgi:hypothetical protein
MTSMSNEIVPGSPERVLEVLAPLFRGHGVNCIEESGVLRFPDKPDYYWLDGCAIQRYPTSVQLDVRLGVFPGRYVIESVVGVRGTTPQEKVDDALYYFMQAVLHVLIAGFFGQPECHGTSFEMWNIGGIGKQVFIGPCTNRMGMPVLSKPDAPRESGGWLKKAMSRILGSADTESPEIDMAGVDFFLDRLKKASYADGDHWVRLYHARKDGDCIANEVLLDNEPWDELQDSVRAFDWPIQQGVYDVRIFIIIRG